MLINRLLAIALLAGFIAGTGITAIQHFWTVPMILHAETFEGGEAEEVAVHDHDHGHGAADHHAAAVDEAWAPEDGTERTFWTWATNVILGVGAAMILASLFSLKSRVDGWVGLGWGLTAALAITLAPAIGLPPELPGMMAAELGHRQEWWFFCAAMTAGGIATAFYAKPWVLRLAGLGLLALPHLVGAPHGDGSHALGMVPAELWHDFIVGSLVTSSLFWVSLGGLTGHFAAKLLPDRDEEGVPAAV